MVWAAAAKSQRKMVNQKEFLSKAEDIADQVILVVLLPLVAKRDWKDVVIV